MDESFKNVCFITKNNKTYGHSFKYASMQSSAVRIKLYERVHGIHEFLIVIFGL